MDYSRTIHPEMPSELQDGLLRALAKGPKRAFELVEELKTSQPSLSRTIHAASSDVTSFRVPGQRAPLYASLRQLPLGLSGRQRIHRVLSDGRIVQYASVDFLTGGGTLEKTGDRATFYEGLPPYMAFAAPSGFLGRELAHQAARTQAFPASLRDWSDEHRIAYLFTQGLNLSGNLIFGDLPLEREMEFRAAKPIPASDKVALYVEQAAALKSAAYGSSAGGEQPKFLSLAEDSGHVIVKFAKAGSRMADLLPLEHLSLRALGESGVPTAATRLFSGGDYVFLEVERFDRLGRTGRVGMLSAGSVDDEFFGIRDSWSQFAARCEDARYLTHQDAVNINIMAAFSELIGNTDRHFENISLLIDDEGEYKSVAPAYDILPMRYASLGGGVDPDFTPIEPKVGAIGTGSEIWEPAALAAERFWRSAQAGVGGTAPSDAIRSVARLNLQVANEFAAPLRSPR